MLMDSSVPTARLGRGFDDSLAVIRYNYQSGATIPNADGHGIDRVRAATGLFLTQPVNHTLDT